jgi:hypothetical protein
MFFKFWEYEKNKTGEKSLPRPDEIPQSIGIYLAVKENKDPKWVWKLKGVVRPTEKKSAFYCRLFDEAKAAKAGVNVKDWHSLDEHIDLIIWEGYFDKKTNVVRPEKFAKP